MPDNNTADSTVKSATNIANTLRRRRTIPARPAVLVAAA